jgi:glycerate kinase
MVQTLDQALARFADLTARAIGQDLRQAQGAGAAGGLGFAAMAWLNAQMRPGVEVVADLTQLSSHLSGADLVITGEGRMDSQTLQGKTPWGVMQLAQNQNIPVIAIVGSLGHGYQNLYPAGLTAAFSLTNGPIELSEALEHAAELLEARATDVMRLWVSATHAHAMRHSSE